MNISHAQISITIDHSFLLF